MAISYGRTDIETPIHADIKETISHGIIVSNLAYLVGKELGLPLLAVLAVYWWLNKKNQNMVVIMLMIVAVSLVGAFFGIF